MKAKNLKKIITLAVSVLYVLVGFLTGGLFFATTKSSAATSILNAVQNYGAIESGKYSYLYLGEYPQRRVLEVTNGTAEGKTGWDTFPNFCPDSVYVENTIKGYVAELNEQYYNKYLKDNTSNPYYQIVADHFTAANAANSTTTNFGTYDWENSTVLTFYPQQNFETKNLYFDYKTGYYTLKTNVIYPKSAQNNTPGEIAYSAGTKFHTYNHIVDSVSKFYGFVKDGTTDVVQEDQYNDLTLITETTGFIRTNENNWKMSLDIGATSYNTTSRGQTYIYLVEPIKWRVLSITGNNALLLSESILDSVAFNYNNSQGTEWAYSIIRSWMNSEDITFYKGGQGKLIASDKGFIDIAFTETIQSAIKSTTNTQDTLRSYYNNSWHYYGHPEVGTDLYNAYAAYTGGNAWDFSAALEPVPQTTDKVFCLSATEARNADYGFGSILSNNTDYAIATGNGDRKLQGARSTLEEYSQGLDSSFGGHWWSRSAPAGSNAMIICHQHTGGVANNSINATLGVRPAMNIDLSKLDVASIGVNSKIGWLETDGVEPTQNGTADSPVKLGYEAQTEDGTKVNTSVAYSFEDNRTYASIADELTTGTDMASIKSKMGGSWQVVSAEKITSGTYANKYRSVIKVNYTNQPTGTYLVAMGLNTVSKTRFTLAPITSKFVNPTTPDNNVTSYYVSGVTYFEVITDSLDNKFIIYSSNNGVLSSANIYAMLDANSNTVGISSFLQGYVDNGNTYDYIYMGEYPKTSVAKKVPFIDENADGIADMPYGTFITESVNVSNEIFKIIDELNDSYYNDYLKNNTNSPIYKSLVAEKGSYPFADGNYNWLDTTTTNNQGLYKNDANLTVEFFYPLEDYQNEKISFDSRNAYYTLLKDVTVGATTYKSGQKFHTYSNIVDIYHKFGLLRRVNTNGTLNAPTSISDVSLSSKVAGDGSNKTHVGNIINMTNWIKNLNGDGVNVTMNYTKYGSTYLFEVEPIKWRVLEVNGSQVTIVSDDLVDAVAFNYTRTYSHEWQFSTIRSWLNGIEESTIYTNTASNNTYKYYTSDLNFFNRAFGEDVQNAMIPKKIVQTNDMTQYQNVTYYYSQTLLDQRIANHEKTYGEGSWTGQREAYVDRPVTYDKVWFLDYCGSRTDVEYFKAEWGFTRNSPNMTTYNSDYSIAAGNNDSSIGSTKTVWEQNTREKINSTNSSHAGSKWSRTSYYGGGYAAWPLGGGDLDVRYSLGAWVATIIDLSRLNVSSVVPSDNSFVNGTAGNPVDTNASALASQNTFSIYSVNPNSFESSVGGTWKVLDVKNSATEGMYTHSIRVEYKGLSTNAMLSVAITDKTGKSVGFATVASGAVGSNGATFFSFDAPTNITNDYVVAIYESINNNMVATNIFEETKDGVIGFSGTIWLDPVMGNDRNSGMLEAYPIKTLERAMEIAGKTVTIIVKSTIYVTTDTVIDFGPDRDVTLIRWYDTKNDYHGGYIFDVGVWDSSLTEEQNLANKVKLTLNNFTIDGSNMPNGLSMDRKTVINVQNGDVVINSGFSAINNCIKLDNEDVYGGFIRVRNSSSLTINGGYFYRNYMTYKKMIYGGLIGAINCDATITINGGEFDNTGVNGVVYQGGVVFASDIKELTVNGGLFKNTQVSSFGCAVCVKSTPIVNIVNARFEGNKAGNSGGTSGAVYIEKCNANIRDCIFKNNASIASATSGAALYITSSEISIVNCSFIDNVAKNTAGAAFLAYSKAYFNGCEFSGNNANHGGAINILRSNRIYIEDCDFVDNYSRGGNSGAVRVEKLDNEAYLKDCRFVNNQAKNGDGGAIFTEARILEIENCDFINNSSLSYGGAICTSINTGELNIIGGSFIGNHTTAEHYSNGGAIHSYKNLTIDGVIFKGNYALNGGAISRVRQIYNPDNAQKSNVFYIENEHGGEFVIKNSIFDGNYATSTTVGVGGAILTQGQSNGVIDSCIFKNNTALVGGAILGGPGFKSKSNTFKLDIIDCSFENNTATGSFSYCYWSEEDVYTITGGGAVAMLGNAVNIENSNFYSNKAVASGSGGGAVCTTDTCKVITMINSSFIANESKAAGSAVKVYNDDNTVGALRNFENCYFEDNGSSNLENAATFIVDGYPDIGSSGNKYKNLTFIGNKTKIALRTRGGVVDGCYFAYNFGWAISSINSTTIKNSTIEYNMGAIVSASSMYILDNTTIKNNFNPTGAYGNVSMSSANFNLSGSNLYIYDNYKNLKDESGNLIDNPYNLILDSNGNIVANEDAIKNNVAPYGSLTKIFVYNGLVKSKIGFSANENKVEDNLNVVGNSSFAKFFDPDIFVLDNAETIGAELYYKDKGIYLSLVNKAGQINYTADDYYGVYDNQYHTININVYGLSNYTISYGLTEGVYNLTSAPEFRDVTLKDGSTTEVEGKTVYFKISAPGMAEVIDSRSVTILKRQVNLNINTNNKGILSCYLGQVLTADETVLNPYLTGVYAYDEEKVIIPGNFYLYGGQGGKKSHTIGVENSILFCLRFVPHNPNYEVYNYPSYIGAFINTVVSYDNLWYLNGSYYPQDPSVSTDFAVVDGQNGIDLNTMIGLIKDGGTLYLGSTYEIVAGKTVNLNIQKNLYIIKTGVHLAFSVASTAKLNITAEKQAVLKIKGFISPAVNSLPIFYNNGTISIVGINRNIIVRDNNGYANSTYQGNGGGVYNNTGATLQLTDVVFCRFSSSYGGVIYNLGTATLTNCQIDGAYDMSSTIYSLKNGGAIYSNGTLNLYNTIIKDAEISSGSNVGHGGAIYIDDNSTFNMYNSFINGDTYYSAISSKNYGGGLYIGAGAKVYLEDSKILGCRAFSGAGIYAEDSSTSTPTEITLVRCAIDENILAYKEELQVGCGAGMHIGKYVNLTINSGSISDNTAYFYNFATPSASWIKSSALFGNGGAIYATGLANIKVSGVEISDNRAGHGGAVYLHTGCKASFENCIFNNNQALYLNPSYPSNVYGDGGGIYSYGSTIDIKQVDFVNNRSNISAAIEATGNSTVNIYGLNAIDNKSTHGIIGIHSSADVNIFDCYIVNNKSSSVFYAETGTFNMYNGVISYNNAMGLSANKTDANIYGGEISYNTSRAIQLTNNCRLVLDGANILNNCASGIYDIGTNIYVMDTVSTVKILSGKVLSAVKNSAFGGRYNDIYFYGLSSTDLQFEFYGGEIDSVSFAQGVKAKISGNVKVNVAISSYFKNLNSVDSTEVEEQKKISTVNIGVLDSTSILKFRCLNSVRIDASYSFCRFSDEVTNEQIEIQKSQIKLISTTYGIVQILRSLATSLSVNVENTYVYFDPVNGDDTKTGLTIADNAVKTWQTVVQRAKENNISKVYIVSTWTLANGENIEGNNLTIVRLIRDLQMISVNSGVTATINNIVLDGGNEISGYKRNNLIKNQGTLTLKDVTIKNAISDMSVGERAFSCIYNMGTLNCNNCYFVGNGIIYNSGGAIYSIEGTTVKITDSFFENNYSNHDGGAIYIKSTDTKESSLTITNSVFLNNRATSTGKSGGAIAIYGASKDEVITPVRVKIDGCQFNGNAAINGGALYAYCADVEVKNSKFYSNRATAYGGAIRFKTSKVVIDNCEALDNKSTAAGTDGIFISVYNTEAFTLDGEATKISYKNVTVMGNRTTGDSVVYGDHFTTKYDIEVDNIKYINNGTNKLGSQVIGYLTYFSLSDAKLNGVDYVAARTFNNLYFENNVVGSGVIAINDVGFEARDIKIINNTSNVTLLDVRVNKNDVLIEDVYFENNLCGNTGSGAEFLIYSGDAASKVNFDVKNFSSKNSQAQSIILYRVSNNVDMSLENIRIDNFKGRAISLTGTTDAQKVDTDVVLNNVIISNGKTSGVFYIGLGYCNSVTVNNVICDGMNISRNVNVTTVNSATFNNCYFRNGKGASGSGINTNSPITVNSCYFENNYSSEFGGAVYASAGATFSGCKFINNSASKTGGAVNLDGGSTISSSFEGCYFEGNNIVCGKNKQMTGYQGGGAIYAYDILNIEGCIFRDNTSNICGGAIMTRQTTNIVASEFYNNYSYSSGGALFTNGANHVIDSCYFEGNISEYSGAAIAHINYGGAAKPMYLTNSRFVNNQKLSTDGRGVVSISIGYSKIDNCIFEYNYSENEILSYIATLSTLSNSNFVGNVAIDSNLATLGGVKEVVRCNFYNNDVNIVLNHNGLLDNCEFGNNTINAVHGIIWSSSTINAHNCSFFGNISTAKKDSNYANLFYSVDGCRYNFVNCNFYDNIAYQAKVTKTGLFFINGGEILLDGCYISNNLAFNATLNSYEQASVHVAKGYLMMRGCVISAKQNSAFNICNQGIVYIKKNTKPCLITDCVVENINVGSGSVFVNDGTLNITNLHAYNNSSNNGSIITNRNILNIAGEDTLFEYNLAETKGGNIYNANGGRITISDGKFANNTANNGGVIYNDLGANLTIENGTFDSNTAVASAEGLADGNGGAIYNLGNLTINYGYFTQNLAQNGGAIYNLGNATINDALLYKNYTTIAGGAICNTVETLADQSDKTFVGNMIINYAELDNNNIYTGQTEEIFGSAIYNGSELTINDVLSKNSPANNKIKGGIYASGQNSRTLIMGGDFKSGKHFYATNLAEFIVCNATISLPSGESIVANNASMIFDNCYFTNEPDTRCINSINVNSTKNFVIRNSTFKDLSIGYSLITTTSSPEINLQNCIFDNVISYAVSTEGGFCNSFNGNINLTNCTVKNCNMANAFIFNHYDTVTYTDCYFSNNVANNLIISNGKTVINGCLFENNDVTNIMNFMSGKAIIANTDVINNTCSNVVYVGEQITTPVIFIDNNNITNNKVTDGAVKIAYSSSQDKKPGIQIGNGGKLVVKDNYLVDANGNYIDSSKNPTTDQTKYVQSNVCLPNLATQKAYIVGGLASGSCVGINVYLVESGSSLYNEFIAIKPKDQNNPILTADINCLFYDNTSYGLALIDGNIVLVKSSEISGDKVYVNNKVFLVDGEYKCFEKSDFEVYKNGVKVTDFNVLFAEDERAYFSNNFTETCPKYASLGSYDIWYKLVDLDGNNLLKSDGTTYNGVVNIALVKNVLTLVETPVARLSKGDSLSNATFVGGRVVSDGKTVAGIWQFEETDTIPTENLAKYSAKFVAASNEIYTNEITANVSVEFLFNTVTYKTKAGINGDKPGFFVGGDKFTGITLISEIVKLMAKNSVIILDQTYNFVKNEDVKPNVNISIRHSAGLEFTMFTISNETDVIVNFGGSVGRILIDGRNNNYAQKIFVNNSTLNLGANVEVLKFTQNINSEALIINNGTLNINGTTFTSNKNIANQAEVTKGSLIYNKGKLVINSGNFVNNTMARSGSDDYIAIYGGVIYNDRGDIIINGGTFTKNGFTGALNGYGGVIYNNQGNVDICGGVFSNNTATYGGVIANKGGKIVFSGGLIIANSATIDSAVIYNDESDADQSKWGSVVYNGTNMIGNYIVNPDSAVASIKDVNLWVVFGVVLGVAMFGIFAGFMMHKARRGKQK